MDELIDEIALKHQVDPEFLRGLISYERTKVHLQRRRGAKDELRRRIEKHIEEQPK